MTTNVFECMFCRKQFSSAQKNRIFCSNTCSNKQKWKDGSIGKPRRGQNKTCLVCEKVFYAKPSRLSAKTCSQKCSAIHRFKNGSLSHLKKFPKGKKPPKSPWYKTVVVNGKKVRLHRHVAEVKIGRKLLPGEEVHHINGDHLDNRPENLDVMSRSQHRRLHALQRLDID